MGLEDYRVLLKPRPSKSIFPDDGARSGTAATGGAGSRRLSVAELLRALEKLGFVRLPPAQQVGPARLAAPASNEVRLAARQELPKTVHEIGARGEYVVEALVRMHEDSKSGDLLFDSLSMRFAVCQPEGAAWYFLKLVKRMCDTLSLAVVHGEKTYSPEVFWAFRLRANEQIRNQQKLWRELFEGDTDDPALSVEETWGYFLKRHSLLMAAAEKARVHDAQVKRGRRQGVANAPSPSTPAPADMEATLPPKIPKPVPAQRVEKS